MLKFRLAILIFVIECIAVAVLWYMLHISPWWFLVPVMGLKIFVIFGSANIQSNFFLDAHSSITTEEKKIAISFDDGPNAEFTPKVLAVLEEFQVPATFFVIGKNIAGNENLLKKTEAAGHIIGNHSFSHSFFIDFKTKNGFMEELNSTSDEIYRVLKKRVKFFRPPYGVTTPNIASAVKALDYQVIGWNIRSLDTTNDSEEKIAKRVISQIRPGAMILFHDTSEKTAQVLKQTLNFAKENGFKIVSTEELFGISAYG